MTEYQAGQRFTHEQVLDIVFDHSNEYLPDVDEDAVAVVEWVPVGTWEMKPPQWKSCDVPCPPRCDRCDRGFVETMIATLDTRSYPLLFLKDGDRMFLDDGLMRYDAAIQRKDGQVLAFVFDVTKQPHGGQPVALSGNQRKEMHRQRQDRRIRELEQENTNLRLRTHDLEQVPENLTTMLDEHDLVGSIPVPTLRISLREWLGTWYDQGSSARTHNA